MSPVALVALKKMMYAGRGYLPGEAFEARDASDASFLTLTGLAAVTSQPVRTKVMEPEPPSLPDREPNPDPYPEPVEDTGPDGTGEPVLRKRRVYRRRDLTAERE